MILSRAPCSPWARCSGAHVIRLSILPTADETSPSSTQVPSAVIDLLLWWGARCLRLIPTVHWTVPAQTRRSPFISFWKSTQHLLSINGAHNCSPLATARAATTNPFDLWASFPSASHSWWWLPCLRLISSFQLFRPKLQKRFQRFISPLVVRLFGRLMKTLCIESEVSVWYHFHVKLNLNKLCQENLRLFRRFCGVKLALLRSNFSLNRKHLIRKTRYQVEGWGRQYLEEISTYHKCYTEPTHDHLLEVLQLRLDCCLRLMHCSLLRIISNYGWSWWLFSPVRPLCHLPQPPERIQCPELSFDFAPFEISEDLDCAYLRLGLSSSRVVLRWSKILRFFVAKRKLSKTVMQMRWMQRTKQYNNNRG